jgi:DNA sulfur modification protein DndE
VNAKLLAFFISFVFMVSCNPSERKISEDVLALRMANDEQAVRAAKEAYVFGYPLVYGKITERYMTRGSSDFINKLINYPRADFKFKNFPYPDPQTYYSCAWLDVSEGPVLFEIPVSEAKFIIYDAWGNEILNSSNFDNGVKIIKFALSDKNWDDILPQDFSNVHLNTGSAFFAYASNIGQKNIKTYPLNFYGKKYETAKDLLAKGLPAKSLPDEPPLKQIQNMAIEDFFNELNFLMLKNKPFQKDAQTLEDLLDINVAAGMRFEPSSFSNEVLAKIKSIPSDFAKDNAVMKTAWTKIKSLPQGNAGYYLRAKTAFKNISTALSSKAVRIISETDSEGEPFDLSKHKYVLHFEKNQIPQGRWSLTAYDCEGFLIRNRLNRYFLSSLDNLNKNTDGSIDIYIQQNPPSKDKVSNWLPVSQTSFKLLFKTYLPNASFDEAVFPAVKKKANKS